MINLLESQQEQSQHLIKTLNTYQSLKSLSDKELKKWAKSENLDLIQLMVQQTNEGFLVDHSKSWLEFAFNQFKKNSMNRSKSAETLNLIISR